MTTFRKWLSGLKTSTKGPATLSVSQNCMGMTLDQGHLREILADLQWQFRENLMTFPDGIYEINLGPYGKEYAVHIKDNCILACYRFMRRPRRGG
jgi:hypothetical protein